MAGLAAGLAVAALTRGPPPDVVSSGPALPLAGGIATPYGEGAGRVWLLRPAAQRIQNVVVYLHGWGAYLPVEWHQAWFEHLLARGSVVVFPAYQDGTEEAFFLSPYHLRDDLDLAFRVLPRRLDVPLVAVGYSVGATLAFVYAGRAREWELPAPHAVYAIFPIDPYEVDPALDLAGVRGRILVRAGDHDDIAGTIGASTLVNLLPARVRRLADYRIVRSTRHVWVDHELLPASQYDLRVRELFWTPLDRLLDSLAAPRAQPAR